mgnify:CR=1 FL=1
MKFDYDIYISYSLADNQPKENQAGWISNFQRFLDTLLYQILGEKPSFLNYGNQEKPSKSSLAGVGVFISVLSPEYVKSEPCIEEIEDFFNLANKEGNLFVNGRERVFKVVKFPVSPSEQPSKIANLLNYDLYYANLQTGEVQEFHDFFTSDAERKFWLKIVDLAYDIAEILKAYRKLDLKHEDFTVYHEKNIYLSETGYDLQLHRDNIKRELTRHGFRILPDHALPTNPKELEISIKKDLERSRLSIHLIGDGYGELAPSGDKSILDLQNKLAGEHSLLSSGGTKKFSRLIWISPDAKLDNDKQKMFVDNLRRELEANEGAEILQSPIEDFKMVVLEELLNLNLNKLKKSAITNGKHDHNKKSLYLIYDKVDDFEAKKLADFFSYKGIEVITPTFEGQLLELREIHLENLKICDSALIYINKVNDLWVQMKFLDLLKAPGLGRTKGDFKKYLLLGKNLKGKTYDKFDVPVIEVSEDIENSMKGLLNELSA